MQSIFLLLFSDVEAISAAKEIRLEEIKAHWEIAA